MPGQKTMIVNRVKCTNNDCESKIELIHWTNLIPKFCPFCKARLINLEEKEK